MPPLPIAQARAVRTFSPIAFAPRPLVSTVTSAGSRTLAPEYDDPGGGSASVTWGEKPAPAPTPWLLYLGIAAAVGAVGYVIYTKKLKKGRR